MAKKRQEEYTARRVDLGDPEAKAKRARETGVGDEPMDDEPIPAQTTAGVQVPSNWGPSRQPSTVTCYSDVPVLPDTPDPAGVDVPLPAADDDQPRGSPKRPREDGDEGDQERAREDELKTPQIPKMLKLDVFKFPKS